MPKEGKGKRPADDTVDDLRDAKDTGKESEISMLDFEDAFEDEFEEEEIIEDGKSIDGSEDEAGDQSNSQKKPWRPGVDTLEAGEVLDFDHSAYHMMHAMQVEYPCMSFFIVHDKLGVNRSKYPHTIYIVTGTQAPQGEGNRVAIMKVSDLNRLQQDDSEDEGDDDEDDNADPEDDPIVEMKWVPHSGCVNRVRSVQQEGKLFVATWAEEGVVRLYNFSSAWQALDEPGTVADLKETPLYTNRSHTTEGFALDWSPHNTLRLLSGDNFKSIYETVCTNSSWKTEGLPYLGHTSSVEDIQWSPTEASVFASCSSDKTVKIWDTRQRKAVLSVVAHESDVNAIAWNKKVAYLLGSGSDDNSLKIWDLRNFKQGQSVAHFQYHNDQICSLEWNPHDDTQILAAGADNQVTIWDLSLEADEGETDEEDIPPQLFFDHMQADVKEAHWHPQLPLEFVDASGPL
jgi:ribosome assembly protein RRB1